MSHWFSYRISAYLQEIIAYLGSDYVFEEASHLLKKLLDVEVSAKQLQIVSEYMGHHHPYSAPEPDLSYSRHPTPQ